MYVMRHGGATARRGLQFVCETLSRVSTGVPSPVRLVPHIFNDSQTYVLEFGSLQKVAFDTRYMRVHKDGASVLNSALTITGITAASPPVVTSNAHGLANGDEVYISGVVGMTQVNFKRFLVNNVAANTFELYDFNGVAIVGAGYTAYSSGGSAYKIVKIATTYTTASDLKYLQFDQAADVLTVCVPSVAIQEFSRTSHTAWTRTAISTFGPTQAAPTNLAGGGGAGNYEGYYVTAVSALTGEESTVSNLLTTNAAATAAAPISLTWTAPAGTIAYYNVYKFRGSFGLYASPTTNAYSDNGGGVADVSIPPPVANSQGTPVDASSNPYAQVVASCQQRKLYSGISSYPGKIWASRPALRRNFAQKSASLADDPIAFTMIGNRVNEVRAIVDLVRPVVLTSGGAFSLEGNSAGGLTPTEVNPKQQSNHGAAQYPQPLVIDGSAVYVQARGNAVLDLGFDLNVDGYRGGELSLFSAHLFEGKTIVDWAYQEVPHRVLWIVLDDGTAASLTYVKEQQITGWARHDTDGDFKNVCVVPESGEDRVYFVVERTIGGVARQYIERMAASYLDDSDTEGNSTIEGYIGADSAVVYDGRAASLYAAGTISALHTMTLSGGTNWTYDEDLTLTASGSYFAATDVGLAIKMTSSAGAEIVLTITGYTGATVVTVNSDITVPAALRSTATTNWAKCITTLTGLDHLEGESLSVLADGDVVANPNDEDLTAMTVSSGAITLSTPASRITAGLPFICDLETLDIDTANGETLVDKSKLVSGVSLHLEKTRGVYVGPKPPSDDDDDPLENLDALKYEDAGVLFTGVKTKPISGQWNSNGRVFIRQIDPVPMTILAVTPTGQFPFRKGGG